LIWLFLINGQHNSLIIGLCGLIMLVKYNVNYTASLMWLTIIQISI